MTLSMQILFNKERNGVSVLGMQSKIVHMYTEIYK